MLNFKKFLFRVTFNITLNSWIGKMNQWWQKAELWLLWIRKVWWWWKYSIYCTSNTILVVVVITYLYTLTRTNESIHFKWLHFILYMPISINFNLQKSEGWYSNKHNCNHYSALAHLKSPLTYGSSPQYPHGQHKCIKQNYATSSFLLKCHYWKLQDREIKPILVMAFELFWVPGCVEIFWFYFLLWFLLPFQESSTQLKMDP